MLIVDDIHHIRVFRRNPDGSVHLVRGADPNLSPGGISPAYDHEAPLGALCAWWAVAYDRFGNEVYRTGEAAIAFPWPDSQTAWLKSLVEPSLSRQVEIVGWEESGRDSRTTMHQVIGSSSRVAQFGTPAPLTATMDLTTHTRADYEALHRLLDSGWLLLDATDAHGIPTPLYLVRTGEMPVERRDYPGWDWRTTRVTVEAVGRPPTAGSRMRVPGSSYAGLPYNSWTEAGAAADTYLDL